MGDGHGVLCPAGAFAGEGRALHTAEITGAAFSSDDRLLVTGSVDGSAKLWRAPEMTWLDRFELPGEQTLLAPVASVDLSADGGRLLVGGRDGRIYLWPTETDRLLQTARARQRFIWVR